MFDLSLAKDFEKRYRQFLIDTTKSLPLEYIPCYEGFVSNMFVRIGRTGYGASKIDKPDFALFIFRNTIDAINRFLPMPVKCSLSNDYNKYYYQFRVKDFNKLPSEFTDYMINERCIHNSRTTTNFSRIIAGCIYKLHNGSELLKVHHRDLNPLNDHSSNLIPCPDIMHRKIFHKIGYNMVKIEECFSPSGLYNENKANKIIEFILTSPFREQLAEILRKRDYSAIYSNPDSDLSRELWHLHNMIAFIEGEKRNYSRQFNDEVLFTIHYLKYFEGLKGRDFDRIKKYNGVKLPCGRSIRNYLKSSLFREFVAYFYYISGNWEKLSTLQKTNLNFIIENSE